MNSAPLSRRTAWARVVALAVAAFIFNTTEFVPVGLLTAIGHSFQLPVANVGIMLTIYAWVVALTSLPFMLLASQIERRKLLIGLFVVFIASHLLSALAWRFSVLVISRIGIAFAHAVFWAITASLALRLAPPGKRAQALSMIAAGSALAMILGLPLGRVIGQYLGWRITFLVIALAALLILFSLIRLLPPLPSERAGSLRSLPALARQPALMGVYLLAVLIITAHYTAYSYIEPFVVRLAGFSAGFATWLLLVLGGAGILGSLLFSKLGNSHVTALIAGAALALTLCLLLLWPAARDARLLMALCLLWGICTMVIGLGMQAQVLTLAEDATDVAMALFSGLVNVGIGAGALLGNQVIAQLSLADIGYVGAVPAALGALLAVGLWRRGQQA